MVKLGWRHQFFTIRFSTLCQLQISLNMKLHEMLNDDGSIILLILVAELHTQPLWHFLAIIINPSIAISITCAFLLLQSALLFAPFDLDQHMARNSFHKPLCGPTLVLPYFTWFFYKLLIRTFPNILHLSLIRVFIREGLNRVVCSNMKSKLMFESFV